MANKTALAVLGVIVLVSMGVGILIGMQLGGPAPAQANGSSNNGGGGGGGAATPIPTDTPNGTETSPTPIPTAGPGTPPLTTQVVTGSATISERTPILPRRFSRVEIEREIERLINENRTSNGRDTLTVSGKTSDDVTAMARGHSDAMADVGKVSHYVKGNTSKDRYKQAGLFDTCQFLSNSETYIVDADGNNLETVGMVKVGREYERNGETRYHTNETQVARALVDDWLSNQFLRPRLMYDNAEHLGVGVEITQNGDAYATTNVC